MEDMKKKLETTITALWCVIGGIVVVLAVVLYRFDFNVLKGNLPYVLAAELLSIVILLLTIRKRTKQLRELRMGGVYVETGLDKKLIAFSILLGVSIAIFLVGLYMFLSEEGASLSTLPKFIRSSFVPLAIGMVSILQIWRIRRIKSKEAGVAEDLKFKLVEGRTLLVFSAVFFLFPLYMILVEKNTSFDVMLIASASLILIVVSIFQIRRAKAAKGKKLNEAGH